MAKKKLRDECITQLTSGSFRVILSHGYDDEGKQRRVTKTFSTIHEARAWRDRQRNLMKRGHVPTKHTVATWFDEFIDLAKRRVEPTTWLPYEDHAKRFIKPMIGKAKLDELTPSRVQKFMNDTLDAGQSSTMVRKIVGTLSVMFNEAVRLQLVPSNPVNHVRRPPKQRRPAKYLNLEEIARLIEAAKGDAYATALVTVWLECGFRPGELFALTWSDIDLDAGTVTVSKSVQEVSGHFRVKPPKNEQSVRTVAISPLAVTALRDHRATSPFDVVFPSPKGHYWRRSNFLRNRWRPLMEKANLDAVPYSARHTMATLSLLAGEDTKVVSDRIGHSSSTITRDVYQHVMPSKQRDLAAKLSAIIQGSTEQSNAQHINEHTQGSGPSNRKDIK